MHYRFSMSLTLLGRIALSHRVYARPYYNVYLVLTLNFVSPESGEKIRLFFFIHLSKNLFVLQCMAIVCCVCHRKHILHLLFLFKL